MLDALQSARTLLLLASELPVERVHAYQLFSLDDEMTFSQTADVFKEARWGNMASYATVETVVTEILDHAEKEVSWRNQRRRFLSEGLTPEFIRFRGKALLGQFFTETRLRSVFAADVDQEMEAILGEIFKRAVAKLDGGSREDERAAPLIDAGFLSRVFVTGGDPLQDGAGEEMGLGDLYSLIYFLPAFSAENLDEPKNGTSGLALLGRWLRSFSNITEQAHQLLDQCIVLLEKSEPDTGKVAKILDDFVRELERLFGLLAALAFSRKLPLGDLLEKMISLPEKAYATNVPTEENDSEGWAGDSDSDSTEEQQAEINLIRSEYPQHLRKISDWVNGGRLPSSSLSFGQPWLRSQKGVQGAYYWRLNQILLFLGEVRACLAHLGPLTGDDDPIPEVNQIEKKMEELLDLVESEMKDLLEVRALEVPEFLKWGEDQLRKISGRGTVRIRPYSIFLYAAIHGLEERRLLPKHPEFERRMIRSGPHPSGQPIPWGVSNFSA